MKTFSQKVCIRNRLQFNDEPNAVICVELIDQYNS